MAEMAENKNSTCKLSPYSYIIAQLYVYYEFEKVILLHREIA